MTAYAVTNPATGQTLATYDTFTDEQIEDAVARAHAAASAPGTVPGAQNVPHTEWFAGQTPAVAPPATAADVAARLGIRPGGEVVTFCNTGHWAATEWFALSELAGLPNVRMYPESMVGYTKGDHRIANKPGLVDNLLRQIKGL